MVLFKAFLTFLVVSTLSGCSSFGLGDKSEDSKSSESAGKSDSKRSKRPKGGDDLGGRGSRLPSPVRSNTVKFGSTLIKSISNNSLTSRTVRVQQAANLAESLGKKDLKDLVDAVAAERIAGTGTSPVLNRAKVLMDKLFTKGIDRDLPESVKLELALAAVQENNLAMANVFLKPLLKAKNPRIRAGAHNAQGVLLLKMDEVPDAVISFKNALKASPVYPAALFNYGMLALKFGDFELARKYLGSLQRDWYAQIGLAVAERHLGRDGQVESLCNRLTRSKGDHKMALYNCGLFYAENRGNTKKGRDMITRATQKPGGEDSWDEGAFKVLEKLN